MSLASRARGCVETLVARSHEMFQWLWPLSSTLQQLRAPQLRAKLLWLQSPNGEFRCVKISINGFFFSGTDSLGDGHQCHQFIFWPACMVVKYLLRGFVILAVLIARRGVQGDRNSLILH